MEIKTKYEVGQRVWIVYEAKINNYYTCEASVYDSYIDRIVIDKNELYYCCNDGNYTELKEDEIILYEDTEKLTEKIKKIMEEIENREKGE